MTDVAVAGKTWLGYIPILSLILLQPSLSFAAAPTHSNPVPNSTGYPTNRTVGNLTAFNQSTSDAGSNKNEATV